MKKSVALRIVLPLVAGALFALLSVASAHESHVIDEGGWGSHSDATAVGWDEEPVNIGTPAQILLLIIYLQALIALLPLLPLTYWIDSEIVLSAAWCLGGMGQWFLIGRYFDIRRRILSPRVPNPRPLLRNLSFVLAMTIGGATFGVGVSRAATGHHSFWACAMDAGFVFWGIVFVIVALRLRSSALAQARFTSLNLS